MFEEDLKKRGNLCRAIKQKIQNGQFSTDLEIRKYVLKVCKENNYTESFPTMVMTGSSVANSVPDNNCPIDLTKVPLYTVDFGLNSSYGYPTDNSCCFVKDNIIREYIQEYKDIIARIIQTLKAQYEETQCLSILNISELVQTEFNKSKYSFFIIPACDAHTIHKDALHGRIIPMTFKNKKHMLESYNLKEKNLILKKGTVFTIEPHVLIPSFSSQYPEDLTSQNFEPISLWEEKTSVLAIILDQKNNIVKYHLKEELPEEYYNYPSFEVEKAKSNRVSFFIEDTYYLDETLIKIT